MNIVSNYLRVKDLIVKSVNECERNINDIKILAVSKSFSLDSIISIADEGQIAFGENYLKEALEKIFILKKKRPDLNLEWHFIGQIQSNKTKLIAENFDWVHTVDRLKIAQRLSDQRPKKLKNLNICIQVKIDAENTKSGVTTSNLFDLALPINKISKLNLRGLMTIPKLTNDFQEQRRIFSKLSMLKYQLNNKGIILDTLSMGMTNDFVAAIYEGATIIRLGSAIFGSRNYEKKT
tara:strand:- start:16 stop:723 length:708 start_codon:yes stop_codon:yes gene_type:complete